MSEEQDELARDADQVIRTGLMALGQVGEKIARHSEDAERARQSREAAHARAVEDRARELKQTSLREEQTQEKRRADAIRLAQQQVGRDTWWQNADGSRVADQLAFVTLAASDPRAADAAEQMRIGIRDRYGIDVERIGQDHPTSELDRRNALVHAIDDWRNAAREDSEAHQSGEEVDDRDPSIDGNQSQGTESEEDEKHAAADALRDSAETEELRAGQFEHEQEHDFKADVRQAARAESPGARARAESAPGYPKSAKQAVNQARRTGAPRARVNRRKAAKAGSELTR